jgi:two-component system phosphate regulon sensor histidine kinase PhoR
MKLPLFLKSFLSYCLIAVLLSISILLISFQIIRHYYINSLTSDLEHLTTVLQLKLTPLVETGETISLDSLAKALGKQINTRITIIDTSGMILADSERDPKTMDNHKHRQEIKQAISSGFGTSIRYSRTVKQEMLYVAIPMKGKQGILAVLRVSLFLDGIDRLINDLKIRILEITVLILILSLGAAAVFSTNLSKPIRELVKASRKIGKGDFDINILFNRKDELKELADSFNHMIAQIKNLVSELSLEKEALNTIISSIQEGVLVLDKKGKIIMSNTSFQKIIAADLSEDKPYWEIIRSSKLSQLVDRTIEQKAGGLRAEIMLQEKVFICSAAFLNSAEQVVLTFHNITELLRINEMKKDFVLNVSHELRTPLTAIKGFTETMAEEKDIANKQYLDIIKRHTDRLIHIVKDLQILAEVEEKETLIIEDVDLFKLISNLIKMFEPELRKKNLQFNFQADKDLPTIKADGFKIEQALINLIDNAIKYTEQGSIEITLKREVPFVLITIRDTGIGIPNEDLARIYERFYVVDKSRSRKMGGTGLGLSIVKHIISAHNGDIRVESTLNKGTKFSILLPIKD